MLDPNPSLRAFVLKLFLVIGIVAALYYGSGFLITLTLAGMFALLLHPVHEKLLAWKWPNSLAIAGSVLLLLIFFGGIVFAVGKQTVDFASDWENNKEQLEKKVVELGDAYPIIERMLPRKYRPDGDGSTGDLKEQIPMSQETVTSAMSTVAGVIADFFLMFVYIVLMLAQKNRLREFVLRRVDDEKRGITHRTLNEARDSAQNYLKARVILVLILSVLYAIGFLVVGLNYAIMLAVLGAVLSIIPYVGNIIALAIIVVVSTGSGQSSGVLLGIAATMFVTQLFESYVLLPLVVGDEVNINPLTTIVGVVGFGLVWGAVGAIVAIPILAIMRIVFSHIDGMRDYAYLLGQEE